MMDSMAPGTPEAYNPVLTEQRILCCSCGVPVAPNPSNMCLNCIRSSIDITEGIPKQATIHFCKGCERYLQPPNIWIFAELESRELLALCIKKLRGLNKVRLVDAGFIWTEPHSKRIKLKLSIQKEVFASTILQQVFVVEYIVAHQHCEECTRVAAQNTWKASVQVRQKVNHKRTFYFLEQLILKNNAHKDTVNILEAKDGIDFFYSSKQNALRMVEFLASVAPLKVKTSEQLISTDIHLSTTNSKHSYSVEIAPICKDDLLCIPLKLARAASNISQLVLCSRIGTGICIIDPNTAKSSEIRNTVYWDHKFKSLCESKDLVEFFVIDVTLEIPGGGADKHAIATIEVCRGGDFATTYLTRSHLGRVLSPGDHVMGYDLKNGNFNHEEFDKLVKSSSAASSRIPDVILVRKSYPNRRKKSNNRAWKLKALAVDANGDELVKAKERSSAEKDYEMFLRDLEEDVELRGMVNLYKDPAKRHPGGADHAQAMETDEHPEAAPAPGGPDEFEDEEPEPDFPEIRLEELMEEMTLDDDAAAGATRHGAPDADGDDPME